MVIRPEQILYQSQLDMLSNFRKQGQDSDGGTAKLVGEIAIRQAEKAAKKVQSSPNSEQTNGNEKRDILHSLLKNVKGSSSVVNAVSNSPSNTVMLPMSSSKGKHGGASSNKMLMVTLGQQKKQQQQQLNKKAICKVCKKECKNFTALAWHERVHKKVSFKCELCLTTTKSLFSLKRHLTNVHHLSQSKVEAMIKNRDQKLQVALEDAGRKQQKKEDEETDSSSDDSSSSDDDEDDEEEEEESPPNTPTCSVCRKTFASNRNVKRHMEIHRREGQNVSNGKLSSEQIAKNRVLQIMDEKNLRCRKCHKQLSGIRRLQQHCCNHFKLNRYRCSQCPYENVDYTQMRRHVMGKHGRHPQFRTIHLISKAIRKMKVGLWINLIVNNEVDDANSTSTLHSKRDHGKKNTNEGGKKVESNKKTDGSQKAVLKTDVKSDKNKNGDASKSEKENASDKTKTLDVNKGQITKVSMPLVMVERASRSRESRDSSSDRGADATNNSSTSPIPSTSIKPKLMVKKESESSSTSSKTTDIVLRNSSRSSSPASARKPVVPESPKRETPIRQARLNHRSVSSRVVQKLNMDEDEASTPTTNGTSEIAVLMDKRQNRCLDCNKQFQHLRSLRRHVLIHLAEKKNAAQKASSSTQSKTTTSKSNPENDSDKPTKNNIDSFINFNQMKCTKCRKRFPTMSALKRHVGRHLGYTTFKCRYCSYISHSYTWFKKHLVLSHRNNIKNAENLGKLMASMRVVKKKK